MALARSPIVASACTCWSTRCEFSGSCSTARPHHLTASSQAPARSAAVASRSSASPYSRASRARSPSSQRSNSGASSTWKPSSSEPPYARTASACWPEPNACRNERTSETTTVGSRRTRSPTERTAPGPSVWRMARRASRRPCREWASSLSGQSSARRRSRVQPRSPHTASTARTALARRWGSGGAEAPDGPSKAKPPSTRSRNMLPPRRDSSAAFLATRRLRLSCAANVSKARAAALAPAGGLF